MNFSPRKVLLSGDWHGNIAFAREVMALAVHRGADAIFQLGDFGYWAHTLAGGRYLDRLEALVQKTGVPIYWLDGNHDNHMLLRADHDAGPNVFWNVRDGVKYSPRGHRWTWRGVRFMSLGGAASVDRQWRKEAREDLYPFDGSWWETEYITDDEVEYASRFDGGPNIDVLLTHEAPEVPPLMRGREWKVDPMSEHCRAQLRRVIEATGPRRLYHGHWHLPSTDEFEFTKVRGLDADVNYDTESATLLIELSDGEVHEARP